MAQLLHNAKGVTRLSANDDVTEGILRVSKSSGLAARDAFDNLKSTILATLSPTTRVGHVETLSKGVRGSLSSVSNALEKMVVKDISMLHMAKEDEMGDLVEREMMAAARAIEEAAARLKNISSKPNASTIELNVHRAILDAALAMTNAIANLIKYATMAQQEIVAHGRGNSTRGAFYKKNNRWTDGLVSAAKAVAIATNILVEAADGVVNGTHSMEQLVVAATEVSAATTQLVSASRVKAVPGSKAQGKLEAASSAVRDAVKLLVKAAKEASKRNAEEQVIDDLKKMGPHEYKVKEMEQQVRILELEKDLMMSRQRLGEMRKRAYHGDAETGLDGKLGNLKLG